MASVGAAGAVLALIVVIGLAVRLLAARQAHQRAEAVLRTHLSEPELAQLKACDSLDVPSAGQPGRVYRVGARDGRVFVRQDGARLMELCIRPGIKLPGREHVLAHKLMIQAAEDEYLARARVVWRAGQATVAGRYVRLD